MNIGEQKTIPKLESSGSEILQVMKCLNFIDEDLQQDLLRIALNDGVESEFMAWLSQAIDSKNILSSEQIAEYEDMGNEVLSGTELDRKFNELFPDTEWYDLKDDEEETILQAMDQAESHISVVTQLESILRNKINQLSVYGTEEKEREVEMNMLCLSNVCQALDRNLCCVYSEFNELLKNFAKIPSRYKAKNSVSSMLDKCKKQHKKFDKCLHFFIKTVFEDAKLFTEKLGNDRLEDISKCYLEMKLDNLLLLVNTVGYEQALKELKQIMESVKGFRFTLSFSDMRDEQLTQALQINKYEDELMALSESTIRVMCNATEIEMAHVQQARMMHHTYQQQCILKYVDILDRATNARLQTIDLFLLTLIVEKQQLNDILELITEIPKDVIEKFNTTVVRVETMRSLASKENLAIMEHPLVQCLSSLYLGKQAKDLSSVINAARKLDCEIKQLEETLFTNLLKAQRTVYLNNCFIVEAADRFLCYGLTKKPQLESVTFLAQYSAIEQLLQTFKDKLNELKNEFKRRQMLHACKPVLAEKRLLWTYFVVDPAQFLAKITNMVEMAKRKQIERESALHHRKLVSLLPAKYERF